MTRPKKVPLNLQIHEELKDRVVRYANRRGLSIVAAATVLLDEALEQDEARRNAEATSK